MRVGLDFATAAAPLVGTVYRTILLLLWKLSAIQLTSAIHHKQLHSDLVLKKWRTPISSSLTFVAGKTNFLHHDLAKQ